MELELSLNGLAPLFTPEQSDRGGGVLSVETTLMFSF